MAVIVAMGIIDIMGRGSPQSVKLHEACIVYAVVSSYKESNNKPMYGYNMLPNLSPRPNLYKVQSIYNNNVAS